MISGADEPVHEQLVQQGSYREAAAAGGGLMEIYAICTNINISTARIYPSRFAQTEIYSDIMY